MLDAVTSAIGYIFPWGGGVLIGYQTICTLESSGRSFTCCKANSTGSL